MNAITLKKVRRARTPSPSVLAAAGAASVGVLGSGVVTGTIVTRDDDDLGCRVAARARRLLAPALVAHHAQPHPQREQREDPPLHGVRGVAPPHAGVTDGGGHPGGLAVSGR